MDQWPGRAEWKERGVSGRVSRQGRQDDGSAGSRSAVPASDRADHPCLCPGPTPPLPQTRPEAHLGAQVVGERGGKSTHQRALHFRGRLRQRKRQQPAARQWFHQLAALLAGLALLGAAAGRAAGRAGAGQQVGAGVAQAVGGGHAGGDAGGGGEELGQQRAGGQGGRGGAAGSRRHLLHRQLHEAGRGGGGVRRAGLRSEGGRARQFQCGYGGPAAGAGPGGGGGWAGRQPAPPPSSPQPRAHLRVAVAVKEGEHAELGPCRWRGAGKGRLQQRAAGALQHAGAAGSRWQGPRRGKTQRNGAGRGGQRRAPNTRRGDEALEVYRQAEGRCRRVFGPFASATCASTGDLIWYLQTTPRCNSEGRFGCLQAGREWLQAGGQPQVLWPAAGGPVAPDGRSAPTG